MTLSVSIATPHSIWTLADRQLTEEGTQSTDVCKIVGFDATDGIGLLSYAGAGNLGDTDPADWVASVFQGLDTDFRGYMVALAEAASSVVPAQAPGSGHSHLFVAAGVADGQPVTYTLTRKENGALSLRCHEKAYAFMVAGAGGAALAGLKERLADDATEILDWIRKAEAEESHPREVVDRLVKWNSEARRESDDVGARSIVAYRFVRDGHTAAGRCFHDGTKLEAPDAELHHLSRGADVNQMFELMKRQAMGATLSLKETAALIAYKRRESESSP